MRWCSVCKKVYLKGNGNMFAVPKDEATRNRWSELCGKNFKPSSLVCSDHFLPSSIVHVGPRVCLLSSAEPRVCQYQANCAENNVNTDIPKDTKNNLDGNQKGQCNEKILDLNNSNVIPPQLREEPIMQIPQEEPIMQITVIKEVSCAKTTQTNTRLCGLVETSDCADEFRFCCFYCSDVFPLEKWKRFVNHLKEKHFEMEEAFKTSEYISEDHDYTAVNLTPPIPPETSLETVVYNAKSFLVDPLESTNNPMGSMDLNSLYCTRDANKMGSISIIKDKSVSVMRRKLLRSKKKLKKSFASNKNRNFKSKHASKVTPLSRCLKRTTEIGEDMSANVSEEYDTNDIAKAPQISTEITFEYTPRDIVDSLLDCIKNYPVLWQFDDEPFNEDYYEAVEDLCKIINDKWSLNIDNLKMRRSINRILRYYCYLYPNANIENINQFTCFYDKCNEFLPSVHEIAYARCSHCYKCFRNDFDLKLHLRDELSYLQWPYKCAQCKECFREIDEFEFHNHLPHYDEIFRCVPCNKSFFRLHQYKKHNAEYHSNGGNRCIGKHKCDICDRVLQTMGGLRIHKKTHGEKKYNCHLCPKSFFEKSKLKTHIKTHKKEYDYMCEVCGKEFILQSGLRTHMKKHTGEKVTCNICNLRLRKSSLSRHLRTVHVVREGCVESTVKGKHIYLKRLIKSRPARRTRSRRKCGEERIYRCKICKITFEKYKLIVEHNRELHSDMPRWPCKMCITEFREKMNLKRHYRRKHDLHVYQVYKLIEENEDLNEVLAMKREDIDKLFEDHTSSKDNLDNMANCNMVIETQIKTDILPDDIYFEGENIYNSIIKDEIMKPIETEDIKTDIIDDLFTDF